MCRLPRLLLVLTCVLFGFSLQAQSWKLSPENIDSAIQQMSPLLASDSMRPAFHLVPPAGCMGDPNGGIFEGGWYHIFYGQQPFAWHPGGWYWAHARSRDLLSWEHMSHDLTPAFELGLSAVGSGSTIRTATGKRLAFYSASKEGEPMKFWQAQFEDANYASWQHAGKNPVLTLAQPGLPDFHEFWRDPFVFATEGRTFMIACADLLDADYVPVPIFEAQNKALTDWVYKGILFSYPKHKLRNLEVPELRQIGDKWILMASSDAPVDRSVYFIGDFDLKSLKFTASANGVLDYSGHYYAQETIVNEQGDIYLMSWMPGWDREWLPTYMNEPLKNNSRLWNGCFALPRILRINTDGKLIQQPVSSLKALRAEATEITNREVAVTGPMASFDVLESISGNQLELQMEWDLHTAAMCGLNVLCDSQGQGGLFINWSGDLLNVDGVQVPISSWEPGSPLSMQIFVDKMLVEIFVNGGRHCISRQVRRERIRGDRIALTALGGTAKLNSLKAWTMNSMP